MPQSKTWIIALRDFNCKSFFLTPNSQMFVRTNVCTSGLANLRVLKRSTLCFMINHQTAVAQRVSGGQSICIANENIVSTTFSISLIEL